MSNVLIDVTLRKRSGFEEYYEVSAEHGYADVTFDSRTHWLGIANIFVEPEFRKNGFGKAILNQCVELADDLQAKCIYAAIISRESLSAFRSVFGEDALTIGREGTFTPEGEKPRHDADAMMWFELR